jgi:hypothetical protein
MTALLFYYFLYVCSAIMFLLILYHFFDMILDWLQNVFKTTPNRARGIARYKNEK